MAEKYIECWKASEEDLAAHEALGNEESLHLWLTAQEVLQHFVGILR